MMLRIKDLILLVAAFASMVAGVYWPSASKLGPFLSWFLMGMLFMSFLMVFPSAIWDTFRRYPVKLALLILAKLIMMPLIIYPLAISFLPAYALGLVLLAGASTALSAPFFVGFVGGNIPLVLGMTVVTTLMLPLTLPLVVKVLIGKALHFDLIGLVGYMATMIFVPLLAAVFFQRVLPRITDWLDQHSYPISLVLFSAFILGAFGLYSPFIRAHQAQVVISVLIGSGLGVFLTGTGMILFWSSPSSDRIAAAGALGWINIGLVIVVSTYFNDPLALVLAALYNIPFYLLIIPLKHLTGAKSRS